MARDIDDPGGEYVSVQIRVNGHVVFMRDCTLKQINPGGVREYKVDDSDTFTVPSRTQAPTKEDYKDIAQRLMLPRGQR